MIPWTPTLYSANAPANGNTGPTCSVPRREGRDHVTLDISITGVLTLVIEGQVLGTDAWVQLASVSASGSQSVLRMPRMRARVSAGGGAGTSASVTSDTPVWQNPDTASTPAGNWLA